MCEAIVISRASMAACDECDILAQGGKPAELLRKTNEAIFAGWIWNERVKVRKYE